jgi:hypothetical protein
MAKADAGPSTLAAPAAALALAPRTQARAEAIDDRYRFRVVVIP